jgi:hypothetical protein
MTEPEERGTGWQMNTGFAGNVDATASATSGADRSMTEPEEHELAGECSQPLPAIRQMPQPATHLARTDQ